MKRYKKIIIITIILVLLIILGIIINSINNKENKNYDNSYDLAVEIKGCVNIPAIYYLPERTKVKDLIDLAGGLTNDADSGDINYDLYLTDGMVINIKKKKNSSGNIIKNNLININTCSIKELTDLDGIGEKKAQAIIDYRESYGPFNNIEELKNVQGISNTIYNKIKEFITV